MYIYIITQTTGNLTNRHHQQSLKTQATSVKPIVGDDDKQCIVATWSYQH